MKKVSIIIPFVKDRGFLQEAINSVKKQSYPNIEMILSQSNNGVSYNINRGIERSTGDYIKYLCDDDILPTDSIMYSAHALNNSGRLALHGKALNFFPDGKTEIHNSAIPDPDLKTLIRKNVIHGGTLMYHRSVFDKVGLFDESLWTGEELEFNLRCLANGVRFAYCNEILYHYRRHRGQKSDVKNKQNRIIAIKEIRDRYNIKTI